MPHTKQISSQSFPPEKSNCSHEDPFWAGTQRCFNVQLTLYHDLDVK